MSAENGTADTPEKPKRRLKLIPFGRKRDKKSRVWPDFGAILSTLGEIAGISAIAVGCGWYSPGLGFISGGIGLVVISFAAGLPVKNADSQ